MPESISPDWACLHTCGTVRAQCSQFNLITESPGVYEARSSLPSILEIVVWKYLGKSWPSEAMFWSGFPGNNYLLPDAFFAVSHV